MTSAQLIEEGRKLQRPCSFLRPNGSGAVAAVWYHEDEDEIETTGHHCWLTVDATQIPGLRSNLTGYISVFSDQLNCEGGRVEVSPAWLDRDGIKLYSHAASVLPPIDAVFARGSEAVGDWLKECGWDRSQRYNGNFKDAAIVREYERVFQQEYPMYLKSDIYAVLGGWHFPMADDDWHELIDDQLMVFTLHDAEPWVEAWLTPTREFRVIQRTT